MSIQPGWEFSRLVSGCVFCALLEGCKVPVRQEILGTESTVMQRRRSPLVWVCACGDARDNWHFAMGAWPGIKDCALGVCCVMRGDTNPTLCTGSLELLVAWALQQVQQGVRVPVIPGDLAGGCSFSLQTRF